MKNKTMAQLPEKVMMIIIIIIIIITTMIVIIINQYNNKSFIKISLENLFTNLHNNNNFLI